MDILDATLLNMQPDKLERVVQMLDREDVL